MEGAMGERLRVTPAEARLDRVSFNPKTESSDHVIEVGTYVCPWCSKSIQLNTGTLRQFQEAKVSPLGAEWADRCERVRPIGPWEWAADFRCAGCDAAVRIIYGHDGEFAMGARKYRVRHVVEEIPNAAG
jgi:hypothetical protein